MFCPNCGAMNEDSSRFCASCGAPLIRPDAAASNDPFSRSSAQNDPYGQPSGQSDPYGQSSSQNNPYGQYDPYGQNYAQGDPYGQPSGQSNAYGQPGYADPQPQAFYGQMNRGPQYPDNPYGGYGQRMVYSYGITPRNIAVAVILSIVTCGIYELYWLYKVNEEINQLADDPNATGGGMVILFTLITCGIYGIYWSYKMGEKNDYLKGVSGSSAILMLILAIFGLQIVNIGILQDTINKLV